VILVVYDHVHYSNYNLNITDPKLYNARQSAHARLCMLSLTETFLLFLVRFVIADYFAVSDLSVFRDVSEFDKETRVGARNVPNALE
jgi:hypothetical protein